MIQGRMLNCFLSIINTSDTAINLLTVYIFIKNIIIYNVLLAFYCYNKHLKSISLEREMSILTHRSLLYFVLLCLALSHSLTASHRLPSNLLSILGLGWS